MIKIKVLTTITFDYGHDSWRKEYRVQLWIGQSSFLSSRTYSSEAKACAAAARLERTLEGSR